MIPLLQLLFFISSLSLVRSIIWDIEITDFISIQNMNKGIYYEITIEFKTEDEPESNPYPHPAIKLKTNQNAIRTSEEVYNIDLSKENSIQILIGSICDTEVTQATISFVVDKDLNDFNSIEYTIHLISNPFQLAPSLSSLTLSKGEYGIAFLTDYPKNIERIEINLKNTNQALSFEPLTLPIYNPKIPKSKLNSKYYRSNADTIEASTTIEVSLALPSKCFTLTTSSFELQLGINTIKDTTKKLVFFKYTIPYLSALQITPYDYIIPSMLYCALISINFRLPSESDILNQDYNKNNSTLQYFQFFLYEELKEPSITFSNLNKLEKYHLRCIYQNTAIDKSQLTTSTFTSSKHLSILPRVPPASYCVTWFVEKPLDKEEFDKALMNNCNDALINLIPLSRNGCLECLKRSDTEGDELFDLKPDSVMTSICIGSNPTCSTPSLEQDMLTYADYFYKMGENELILELTTEIKVKFSQPVFVENSTASIPRSFTIKEDAHTEQNYNFTFYHLYSLPSNCTLEFNSINKEMKHIPKLEFKLKMGEKKSLGLLIPSLSYDDDVYRIQGYCKFYPNFAYSSSLIEFESDYITHNVTIDCNETPYVSRCIAIDYLPEPQLKTMNPKMNVAGMISSFKHSPLQVMQNFYNFNIQEYIKEKEVITVLKMTQAFFELMIYMDCNKHLFNSCRSTKKMISREVVPKLSIYFPQGVFIQPNFEIEARAKLFIMGLMYSTMNIDSYQNETSREMINYISSVLNESASLIETLDVSIKNQTEEYMTEAHIDMMNMYYTIVDNVINFIEYLQRDGNLLLDQSKYSIINSDDIILQFKYSINGIISTVFKYLPETTKVIRSNYDLYLYTLPADKHSDHIIEMGNVVITLPINTIATKTNAKYVSIIVYKSKHPLLAFNNTNVFGNHKVGVNFYDRDYKPIPLNDLPEMGIELEFKLENAKTHFAYCYYLNNWNITGADISVTRYNDKNTSSNLIPWITVIAVVVSIILIVIIVFNVIYVIKKKKEKEENINSLSQFNINEPMVDDGSSEAAIE